MKGHAHGPAEPVPTSDRAGAPGANRTRLTIVLGLVSAYMVAEVIGGLATNSLALLADAGHMLSDAGAIGLSLFAMWIAQRPPTSARSYGYYRTEILAALVNGATLLAISMLIFIEAWQRFRAPPEVQGGLMMGIAAGGLLVNLAGLRILNAGRGESLNVRGAWLHVLTDALGSVGALLGGAAIWAFGWAWADPAVSVAIGALVIFSTWSLLREAIAVLMEGAPGHIDVDAVRDEMMVVAGISAVHDLHIWSITSGMVALSAHARLADDRPGDDVLAEIRRRLHARFGIDHVTIQIEPGELREKEAHP